MAVTQYFLGGNTVRGFVSFYSGFCRGPEDFLWVIKGGPGCGKSSFMKTIGRAAEEKGLDVEYVLCSGDPESVDGVYFPALHTGYADGTAPSADYSETFFNVLPDDSYGALTFSACTDKGNAASFTITRSTPVVANWVYTVEQTASFTKAAAPTVEWIGHEDLTTPVELAESGNSADILSLIHI